MSHEQIRKVMTVIIAVDSAMGKPQRPPTGVGYPATLVQDAWRALQAFTTDQIDLVLRRVAQLRVARHPAIPPSSEQVLAGFKALQEAMADGV